MTQFIIGFLLSSTAFGQEASDTLHVPAGARLEADGTVTPASQVEAENEIKMLEAQARIAALRAGTVVPPYNAEQVNSGGNDLFGGSFTFSTQVNDCIAAATTQARKAKLEVVADAIARCREIAVDQTKADTARTVALYAIALDRPLTTLADGSISVTQDPATVLARTNNGYGSFGGGNAAMAGYQQVAYDNERSRAAQEYSGTGSDVVLETPTKAAPKQGATTLTPEEAEKAALQAELAAAELAASH